MAHNFRNLTLQTYPEASNLYVNMNGSNLTGDGLATNPYKSVQFALDIVGSKPLVLGCGTYSTVWISTQDDINGEKGLAKYTILDMLGGTSYHYPNLNDVTVKNGTLVLSGGAIRTYRNCIFRDVVIQNNGGLGVFVFYDCDFINCTVFQGFVGIASLIRCKVINSNFYNAFPSTTYGVNRVYSCDVDEFSTLWLGGEYAPYLSYSNIRGNLVYPTGVSAGIAIDIETAKTNYPSITEPNNFSADPLYNDVSKFALTVQTGSPNLGTGENGLNIGNVYRALALFNDITPVMTTAGGATITGFIGTQDLTVDPLLDDAVFITGTIVNNSSQIEYVNEINYVGKIATDSTFGGSSNSQVPDVLDYAIGTKGDNPPRLKYYARWHNGSTPPNPLIGAEWDNGNNGHLSAGTWSLFCFGEKPFLDSTFKGNGHQDFDDTDPSKFQVGAKWFQIWFNLDKELWNTI